MKIILSRKGFDSSYGGYPSPILPDKTLLSLPIPYLRNKIASGVLYDGNIYDPIQYKDLLLPPSVTKYFREREIDINSFSDLMMHLSPRREVKLKLKDKSTKKRN